MIILTFLYTPFTERNFSLSADLVAPVLKFLAEVCHESEMKQWLGGPEGNIFWPVLLTLLCNTATKVSLWPSLISAKHKVIVTTFIWLIS